MHPIEQNFGGQQSKCRSKRGFFESPFTPAQQTLDNALKEPVQPLLNFALDRWQQTKIDKLKLVSDMVLTERFRAMNRLWRPPFGIALKKLRQATD
jgi:hypothetical protein